LEAEAMTSSAKATANEDNSLSYSVTLNDLENSKAYHFYIYVKTEGGTSYFGKYEFSTKALPGIDDISSPGKRD
jgi:ABC-type molybdate transport system substrate-binding protein